MAFGTTGSPARRYTTPMTPSHRHRAQAGATPNGRHGSESTRTGVSVSTHIGRLLRDGGWSPTWSGAWISPSASSTPPRCARASHASCVGWPASYTTHLHEHPGTRRSARLAPRGKATCSAERGMCHRSRRGRRGCHKIELLPASIAMSSLPSCAQRYRRDGRTRPRRAGALTPAACSSRRDSPLAGDRAEAETGHLAYAQRDTTVESETDAPSVDDHHSHDARLGRSLTRCERPSAESSQADLKLPWRIPAMCVRYSLLALARSTATGRRSSPKTAVISRRPPSASI